MALLFYYSAQMSQEEVQQRTPKILPPPFASIEPSMLRIFTFGYKNVYDDFAHLWMMQNFVDKPALAADPKGLVAAVDAVLHHEPKIEGFYLLACFTMLEDVKEPERCEAISKVGMTMFPNSFRIPMMQGYISLFERNDRQKAAAYYAMAATHKDAPPYVEKIVSRLLTQEQDMKDEDLEAIIQELTQDPGHERWQELLKEKYDEIHSRPKEPNP